MSPAEIAACQAALDAAEQAAEALRAVLHGKSPSAAPAEALRVKHVVADYGVSERTARRWAQKWGTQIGGRWLIPRAAIEGRRP